MTREDALQWCVDNLKSWPTYEATEIEELHRQTPDGWWWDNAEEEPFLYRDEIGVPVITHRDWLTASKKTPPPDPVNHPSHYTSHPSGIECIDVTEHMNFNRGNAIKYIWRAGDKGCEIEDLKKARWYIDREIKRMEKRSEFN